MRNKFIAFLMLSLVLINILAVSAFAGTAPKVTVGSVSGEVGTLVEVPVVLSGNSGFSNISIEVGYDKTALKLTGAESPSTIGATFTEAPDYSVNPYNMSWDSAKDVTFNGTLVTLTFEVLSGAKGTYPITVDYYKGRDGNYKDGDSVNYNADFKPLNLTYVNGKITVGQSLQPDEPDEPETYPVISAGSANGKAGDTVKIPLILSGNSGFSNISIEVGYDKTALKLTGAESPSTIGATFTEAPDYSVNPYNMSWDSAKDVTFNGTLVTLTFEVLSGAKGTYPITVDFYKGRDGNYKDGDSVNYNADFEPLNLSYKSGYVVVDVPGERTIAVVNEDKVSLSGDLSEGKIYAALYEGDVFKQLNVYTPAREIPITFTSKKTGDTAVIMWWGTDLKPLCEPVVLFGNK